METNNFVERENNVMGQHEIFKNLGSKLIKSNQVLFEQNYW